MKHMCSLGYSCLCVLLWKRKIDTFLCRLFIFFFNFLNLDLLLLVLEFIYLLILILHVFKLFIVSNACHNCIAIIM